MDVDSLKGKWKDLQPAGANDSLTEANLKSIIGRRYNGLFVRMALPKVLIALGYLYWVLFLTVFFHFFPTVLLQTLLVPKPIPDRLPDTALRVGAGSHDGTSCPEASASTARSG